LKELPKQKAFLRPPPPRPRTGSASESCEPRESPPDISGEGKPRAIPSIYVQSPDLIVLGYWTLTTLLLLVFWTRIRTPGIYLAIHSGVLLLIGTVLHTCRPDCGIHIRFLRTFYPWIIVIASFREIHFLASQIQPFEGLTWDRRLSALDRLLFGDVGAAFQNLLWPPLVDLLTICYWSYFFWPIVFCGVLLLRKRNSELREFLTILLLNYFLCHLCYYIFPALGPHLVEHAHGIARDTRQEGLVLGGLSYRFLLQLELRTPDAFPSGHALLAMICILTALRLRVYRFATLLLCSGSLVATVYLRYHYLVDVLVAVPLLPLCWYGGRAIHRFWEGRPSPG